jgi:hypothetical protein
MSTGPALVIENYDWAKVLANAQAARSKILALGKESSLVQEEKPIPADIFPHAKENAVKKKSSPPPKQETKQGPPSQDEKPIAEKRPSTKENADKKKLQHSQKQETKENHLPRMRVGSQSLPHHCIQALQNSLQAAGPSSSSNSNSTSAFSLQLKTSRPLEQLSLSSSIKKVSKPSKRRVPPPTGIFAKMFKKRTPEKPKKVEATPVHVAAATLNLLSFEEFNSSKQDIDPQDAASWSSKTSSRRSTLRCSSTDASAVAPSSALAGH